MFQHLQKFFEVFVSILLLTTTLGTPRNIVHCERYNQILFNVLDEIIAGTDIYQNPNEVYTLLNK